MHHLTVLSAVASSKPAVRMLLPLPELPRAVGTRCGSTSYVTPAQATERCRSVLGPVQRSPRHTHGRRPATARPRRTAAEPCPAGLNPNAPGFDPSNPRRHHRPSSRRRFVSLRCPAQTRHRTTPLRRIFRAVRPGPASAVAHSAAGQPSSSPIYLLQHAAEHSSGECSTPTDPAPGPCRVNTTCRRAVRWKTTPAANRNCDRIYNDLNCCDSAEGCREFIRGLFRDKLAISRSTSRHVLIPTTRRTKSKEPASRSSPAAASGIVAA